MVVSLFFRSFISHIPCLLLYFFSCLFFHSDDAEMRVLGLDVITPPLDGTILPGVTRQSCLELITSHNPLTPHPLALPHLPPTLALHAHERELTISQLRTWSAQGALREAFAVGTAAIVAGVGRIGVDEVDVVLEVEGMVGGRGPVARALYERIVDIQEGRVEWQGWGVVC